MKNIIRFTSLLFTLFFLHSQAAYAIDNFCCVYGGFGGMDPGVVSSLTQNSRAAEPPEVRIESLSDAKRKEAEEAAKKKADEDAQAAKDKAKCMGLASATKNLCRSNAYTANSNAIVNCGKVMFYTPAMEQCNKSADSYLNGALANCDLQFDLASLKCG